MPNFILRDVDPVLFEAFRALCRQRGQSVKARLESLIAIDLETEAADREAIEASRSSGHADR